MELSSVVFFGAALLLLSGFDADFRRSSGFPAVGFEAAPEEEEAGVFASVLTAGVFAVVGAEEEAGVLASVLTAGVFAVVGAEEVFAGAGEGAVGLAGGAAVLLSNFAGVVFVVGFESEGFVALAALPPLLTPVSPSVFLVFAAPESGLGVDGVAFAVDFAVDSSGFDVDVVIVLPSGLDESTAGFGRGGCLT